MKTLLRLLLDRERMHPAVKNASTLYTLADVRKISSKRLASVTFAACVSWHLEFARSALIIYVRAGWLLGGRRLSRTLGAGRAPASRRSAGTAGQRLFHSGYSGGGRIAPPSGVLWSYVNNSFLFETAHQREAKSTVTRLRERCLRNTRRSLRPGLERELVNA